MALVSASGWARAQARFTEYEVKAAFLYNFAKFVDWGDDASDPLVLAVLGDDPFGATLERALRDRLVRGRPIRVRRAARAGAIGDADVVFVCASERGRLDGVLAALRERAVLTVGDFERFAQRGGMIEFISRENRVHFRINLGATRRAGVRLSSRLLAVAEVVGDGNEPVPAAPAHPADEGATVPGAGSPSRQEES
jgi:hypothetical protein